MTLMSREILEGYLSEIGGVELLSELANYFYEKVPQRLDLALRAVESGDVNGVKYQLHSLKNSFLNVGALGVADECQLMEDRASLALNADLQDGLEIVRQKFEEVRNELETFLATRLAH